LEADRSFDPAPFHIVAKEKELSSNMLSQDFEGLRQSA